MVTHEIFGEGMDAVIRWSGGSGSNSNSTSGTTPRCIGRSSTGGNDTALAGIIASATMGVDRPSVFRIVRNGRHDKWWWWCDCCRRRRCRPDVVVVVVVSEVVATANAVFRHFAEPGKAHKTSAGTS